MEKLNVKLESYTRNRKTPFESWNKINRVKIDYTDGGEIRRNGKTLNLQEYINENNVDATIYEVYEKYRGDKKLTAAQLNTLTHTVSDELSNIKDLPSALEIMKKAEKSWKNLPLEIRKEFNNNVANFQKNGLEWANKKISNYNKKIEEIKAQEIKNKEIKVSNGEN